MLVPRPAQPGELARHRVGDGIELGAAGVGGVARLDRDHRAGDRLAEMEPRDRRRGWPGIGHATRKQGKAPKDAQARCESLHRFLHGSLSETARPYRESNEFSAILLQRTATEIE